MRSASRVPDRAGRLLWLVLAVAMLCTLEAQAAEYRGAYTYSYGSLLSTEEKQNAQLLALQNAVERWIAEKNPSHYKNYERIKAGINSDIKGYLLDYKSTEEQDKKTRTYRVTALVNINEPKLLNRLIESPGTSAQQKKYITFVFVARQQSEKIKSAAKSARQVKQQNRTIETDSADTAATQDKKQTQTIATDDSQTIRQDKIVWDVATANEVDTAMGRIFADADLRVVDAALLERETGDLLKVEHFIEDYRSGSDLKASTKSDAMRGLRSMAEPVDYLAIGTLDIDEVTTDPTTGNVKVAVSVTGQILSILERGSVVAKVGPETSFGEGNTPFVARNNALSHAAAAVASQLIAQLSAKGIR